MPDHIHKIRTLSEVRIFTTLTLVAAMVVAFLSKVVSIRSSGAGMTTRKRKTKRETKKRKRKKKRLKTRKRKKRLLIRWWYTWKV